MIELLKMDRKIIASLRDSGSLAPCFPVTEVTGYYYSVPSGL